MYEKMKDSGIEWIGEIPEDWDINIIKYSTYVKGRIGWQGLKSDEFIQEGPYLVTGTDFIDGRINWESCYHITEERYSEAPEIHLGEGDLLITKDGTIGKIALVINKPDKAILNSGVFVTRPLNGLYLSKYMYWALNSPIFEGYIGYMETGSTIKHLYQETFENFKFPFPLLITQQRIAEYLDQKCAEIDMIIAAKQKQNELLKEHRQAVIYEAVTKGLDKNVKYKDSGIEWIGEIPEDWEVTKVKYHYFSQLGKMLQPNSTSEDDCLEKYLCALNITWDGVYKEEIKEMWFTEKEKSIYEVKQGDLLISEGGDAGRSCICDIDFPCYIQNAVHRVRAKENSLNKYLYYWMYVLKSIRYIDLICNKATIMHFTQDKLLNLDLILPNKAIQQKIVYYLDQKCNEIDRIIKSNDDMISKLKEYRQSVIYEVVTGKIKV
ncbi:MAG: restriction endonuclease subunit S [Clostridiaceae bacterium]|nr:restriction endonuclease subunit S [Clostridiaceae bacterium]